MELKHCLVTQNIASVVEDSLTDSDRLPDIELASGDVTFIPNVPTGSSYQIELTNGQWYSVPLGRIRAKIINGKIFHEGSPGVYLFAAGSGSNPSKISYNVSYSNLRAGGIPFSLNSFTFQAIPDEEIDLTLVKPVPGVSPAGTIRGPRGTSLESIEVDDSHLVFTTVNEAGSFEMARIPISHVVEAEAREAARQAAEGVAEITASNLAASESFKNQASAHADRAETAADNTVADANAQLAGYVEDAQTSATSADASDKSAAAHRAAAKTSETNAKSSETKAKASETKATTEANRSETARTGSEAAQGKAENAAVKAEGMRDSAATHSASASRSESAASKSASNAKASETRAQELADAFDVEALRAEIEARIAELVDGAPDALNTLREIAELASSNKTVQEQLTSAIAGKADKVHTHAQSQVTGLSTALNNKADKSHTHETSQVVGLDNALAGKADKSHTHAQGDISGLSTSLSNKADKTHTHSQSQITGLSTALSGKADKSHTHVSADITDATASATADRVVKRNRSGDFSVNEPVYDSYPANKGYVDALKDTIDGQGASIIPFNSVTGRQRWADGLTETIDAEAPPGRYYFNGDGWKPGRNYDFQVDSSIKYYAAMWVKADKPGSRIYIEVRDQSGSHAIKAGNLNDAGNYLLGNYPMPTEWTLLTTDRLEFHEGVTSANINSIYFNHSNGSERDAVQMLSDIQLIPLAPHTHTSADVTDATDRLGRVSDYDTAGKLVRTNADGQLTVYTSSVTEDSSVANKNYVDIEVGKKANTSHTHSQSQVTGLTTALSGKANKSHTHSQSDITGLSTTLSGKADSTHTHTQGEVTGLTTALNGKAAKSHTHTQAQISGLGTALNGKADKTYVDARPAMFSGAGLPPSSIPGAVVGDFWLDLNTMELHQITGV